jgi:hypothetical protein
VLDRAAMNCVPWLGMDHDLHCAALDGATLVVRNPRPAGGGGELSGTLFIVSMESRVQAPTPRPTARPRRPTKRVCSMVR